MKSKFGLTSLAFLATLLGTLSFASVASANPIPYEFTTSSMVPGEASTYVIKFWVPAGLQIGKISVEFGNPYVDLSNSTLSVDGISGGTPKVDYYEGTSGHIDFSYKMGSVLTLEADTWITMTINGSINPKGTNASVGIGYISISDSTTANRDALGMYNNAHDTSWRFPNNKYIYLTQPSATPTPTPTPTPAPAPTQTPSPTLSFSADQSSVVFGGASTLRWTSTNTNSCAASGAWSGTKSTTSSDSTGALTENRTFTLTCTGPGGTVAKSVSVSVAAEVKSLPNTSPTKGSVTAPAAAPTPTQNAVSTPQTISQVSFASYYYWEGSMTTDLSKISDPSSVDSFTLDWYEEGWVVWTETIDLSTPEALAALDNLDEYVIIDSWYFYMEWEFWAIWETPVAVTLHNPEIVAAPVIYKDGKPADVGEVTVVKNAEGGSDIKFTAKEGGKYEVKHAIVLDNSPVTSTKGETYKLSGYVTDPKAKLVLTVNGEVLGEAIVADPITGKFEKILNVILGNNSIALAASGTEGDILPASLTVNRGEGTSPWVYVLILLMIIALGLHISTRSRNKVIA